MNRAESKSTVSNQRMTSTLLSVAAGVGRVRLNSPSSKGAKKVSLSWRSQRFSIFILGASVARLFSRQLVDASILKYDFKPIPMPSLLLAQSGVSSENTGVTEGDLVAQFMAEWKTEPQAAFWQRASAKISVN
jgi:hypothetical protein